MTELRQQWFKLLGTVALGVIFTLSSEGLRQSLSVAGSDSLAQTAPNLEATEPTSQLNLFQAVILGIVQGLTEFLPISSTAHLKLVPVALGWGDPGVTFTAVIQLGSIAAVLWYFWQDLTHITAGMVKAVRESNYYSSEFRLAVGIGLGTIPVVLLGLFIKVFVPNFDDSALRSMTTIALASIILGLLLGLAEWVGSRKRNLKQLSIQDGILVGLAQALAIIPGVSRSGSTITAGLFLGLKREIAARFSFLLGIPAITLAGLVEVVEVFEEGFSDAGVIPLVVGTTSSGIFSYLAIAWLLRYLQRRSNWIFVWYRLAVGGVILGAIATGMLAKN